MELVSELYRFSANNEIVMDEFSGDMRKLYGRLLDMEPQSFRKWLLDISFSFRERLLNSRSRSTKSFVLKAQEYVRNHYADEELSLDSICRELGVSNSYFSTIFKKETGNSFIGYLTEYRMEQAARMLIETGEKSYIIAKKVGYTGISKDEMVGSTQKLMEQASEYLEDYLVSMRQISDTVYYNVIKENDFSSQAQSIQSGMNLLYEVNGDNLQSIAIYNDYGRLMAAEPVAAEKEDPDVTEQDWYKKAMEIQENMHFSVPHIQNLFDDGTFRYYWVISLSRAVEITDNGVSRMGVLLVDMDYSGIARMMKQINSANKGQYYYLCDGDGQIIYHPQQIQIADGTRKESSQSVAKYKEGVYDEEFEGEHRKVVVNTISYTGWKLVGVIPQTTFVDGTIDIRYFIAMLMLLMAMMLMIINRIVSSEIKSFCY